MDFRPLKPKVSPDSIQDMFDTDSQIHTD